MAKLTPEQWQLAKVDYEVHGFSYTDLINKYGMSRGSISGRAKNENWQQGKNEQLIEQKVKAIKGLVETEQQIEQLEPLVQKSINAEVSERLELEKFFINAGMRNQYLSNQQIEKPDVSISELNQHSQITARNKETVLGKQPDTAIQINNGSMSPRQPLSPEAAKAIRSDLEDEY